MKWIGLTGGIGTGKSTVAKVLRDLGVPVIDADVLAREAVAPGSEGLKFVVQAFGESVLNPDGSLNRQKLAEMVFGNVANRELLESGLHPIIQMLRTREKLAAEGSGAEVAVYDVPLLFEKDMDREFDETWVVYCDPDKQIERLQTRTHWPIDEIRKRISAQIPMPEKLARANFKINNNGTELETKQQVIELLRSRS